MNAYLRKGGCANPACDLYYVRSDYKPAARGKKRDREWDRADFLRFNTEVSF